ncbi:Uncharacterised protein [Vibrio cholerae]|uniref:Uncharacterized protein n=1 Tax=Vibrio cholerae TaxID=666 RepID=A0A655ZLA9_VIBCL|nr:Uncharacterised protein [Vibrio cholerae]CSB31651.1 Uncharacterised protein [Vibrio cholerae]CSB55051.1 Uncharacterised protein [Vibrio cholerae]CSC74790.1 Uncharacterised protein [Vibrio cholerae]CSC79910.1 Uncharacterised protein [Vibrio cholerae]
MRLILLRRINLTCYKFVVDVFGRSYLSDEITDGIARNMAIGTFGANAFRIGKVNRALILLKRDLHRMAGETKLGA